MTEVSSDAAHRKVRPCAFMFCWHWMSNTQPSINSFFAYVV